VERDEGGHGKQEGTKKANCFIWVGEEGNGEMGGKKPSPYRRYKKQRKVSNGSKKKTRREKTYPGGRSILRAQKAISPRKPGRRKIRWC